MRYARRIALYIRRVCHESRSMTALVARMVAHERFCWRFYISTIGVTLMFDHDTTTMIVDNRLRRYREINLCSDDRSSIVALQLLVAEPMSSKRTSWLTWFFACFEMMMLDIFPPYFGFEEALLREKSTEKARCICHTRHSTCSHVDLVVLGVSQHSSLSVLFSVAPPNKCRFGHGKRRVTFHQRLFPCTFCVWVHILHV